MVTILPLVPVGLGLGMLFVPTSRAALNATPPAFHGRTSAVLSVGRLLGAAVGGALGGLALSGGASASTVHEALLVACGICLFVGLPASLRLGSRSIPGGRRAPLRGDGLTMAQRRRGLGPGHIVFQHPGLLAISSAAVVAGMSVTERLVRRRSRGRLVENRGHFGTAPRPDAGAVLRPTGAGHLEIAVDSLTSSGKERSPSPEPDPAQPGPGIKLIYRQGRKAVGRLRTRPSDGDWQELREHSQELSRRVELMAASQAKPLRKPARQARRLSVLLGQDQQLTALEELVRDHPEQLGPEELRLIGQLIDDRRAELRRRARRLAERLYKRKPGKFARRLDPL